MTTGKRRPPFVLKDEKAILVEIENLDVDEKAAVEIFASIEREKRTWRENKKLKMAQRKDRRHFADKEFQSSPWWRAAIRTWGRCLRCRTKISYTPHLTKPDKKKKKGKSVVYVPTKRIQDTKEGAGYLRRDHGEEEQAERGLRDGQRWAGLTSVLHQAITPSVAGQSAILEMTQQNLWPVRP